MWYHNSHIEGQKYDFSVRKKRTLGKIFPGQTINRDHENNLCVGLRRLGRGGGISFPGTIWVSVSALTVRQAHCKSVIFNQHKIRTSSPRLFLF